MTAKRWKAVGAAFLATWLTASCSSGPTYPGDELEVLPAEAIGVVWVAPLGLKSTRSGDRTVVFAFDSNGDVVGKLEGAAQYSSGVVTSPDNLAVSSGRAVTSLTETARTVVEFEYQGIGHGAVNNIETGAATFWFNSGRVSDYASISAEGTSRLGSVPGMVRTSAYCGNSVFAVAEDIMTGSWPDEPSVRRLYELGEASEPIVRGEWTYPVGSKPASRSSACSPDGKLMYSLYASDLSMEDENGGLGLTLVTTEVRTGTRNKSELEMEGFDEGVRGLVLVDGLLVWLNHDGEVLSVPLDGTSVVTNEWVVPGWNKKISAGVSRSNVMVVDYEETPKVTEYDLMSGLVTTSSVRLSWLDSIRNEPTETGSSVYGIAGVAPLTG